MHTVVPSSNFQQTALNQSHKAMSKFTFFSHFIRLHRSTMHVDAAYCLTLIQSSLLTVDSQWMLTTL